MVYMQSQSKLDKEYNFIRDPYKGDFEKEEENKKK